MVKRLVEDKNTNITLEDLSLPLNPQFNQTALMLAVHNRDLELVEYLLQLDVIPINAMDVNGFTALHYVFPFDELNKSVKNVTQTMNLINRLIDAGINVSLAEPRYKDHYKVSCRSSPLSFALRYGGVHSERLVMELVNAGANINEYSCYEGEFAYDVTPLMYATYAVNQLKLPIGIIHYLIEAQANVIAVDSQGYNALFFATLRSRICPTSDLLYETLKILLRSGIDVNHVYPGNKTILLWVLYTSSCKPNSGDVNRWNSDKNLVKTIRLLIDCGFNRFDMSIDGGSTSMPESALYVAVRYFDKADIARMLIEAGASLTDDTFKAYNRTPLMVAAQYGRLNVVRYLLANTSVAVDATEGLGRTALFYAVEEITDRWQETASFGENRNRISIVKELVRSGANLNHQDKNGTTALLLAHQSDRHEVYSELYKLGANSTVINENGETACEYDCIMGIDERCDDVIYRALVVQRSRDNSTTDLN